VARGGRDFTGEGGQEFDGQEVFEILITRGTPGQEFRHVAQEFASRGGSRRGGGRKGRLDEI